MDTLKSLSREHYAVGWVAALSIELAAAAAMLDEVHEKPFDFEQLPSDTNSYTWGEIAKHNVVMANLPAGSYGTSSAANVAMNMLASFPQIRFGLLVGIAAGIPNESVDIRLGDVVVSQPTKRTGGVVAYDFKRAEAGGRAEPVGFLNSPPVLLLNAMNKLKAKHEFRCSVPDHLKTMVQKHPEMGEATSEGPSYTYQGRENDRLFNSAYDHISGDNCDECDSAQVIQREDRVSTNPAIRYGLIASGNTLVKSAAVRDAIRRDSDNDCICLEMEAAGLINDFPSLVIRGICDYADSHKNDRWQRYAAATAAAYAKDLLGVVPARKMEETASAAITTLAVHHKESVGHGQLRSLFKGFLKSVFFLLLFLLLLLK